MTLFQEPHRIRVSAAWASKIIGCEVQYIINGCGGKCCRTASYWPPKSNGGTCAHLGATGCKINRQEMPTVCLLYPFVIKNNLLVLHGRALTGCCKPNYKQGTRTIFEQQEQNLTILFGATQYARVAADVKAGRDSYFEAPPRLHGATCHRRTMGASKPNS